MVEAHCKAQGKAQGEADKRGGTCVPCSALLAAVSRAFAYPAEGLAPTLEPLRELDAGQRGVHAQRIAQVLAAGGRFSSRTDEQLAYTRLFIGSFKMEAPPYASYYLDDDHLMNGQPAVEVAAVYRQFGIELDSSQIAPPDHLRYLLAFCALLARRFEETGDEAFAESYADFRDEFILSWIGECRSLVNRYAESSYYPELIALIVEVLTADDPNANS